MNPHHSSPAFADFNNGWIEIFRAGNYGPKGSFNERDLDRVIAAYDPSHHEAPACIGHPADNLPAYGWASELKRAGDTLLAKFKEVDPDFESAVKAGRFKKRSAAFYLDSEGRISGLRHVAFLGAQPPEVKGLKNLNFNDAGQEFTAVDFEENTMADKSVKDQIKEFFAEMFGGSAQVGSATFSEDDVKRIAAEAIASATSGLQSEVSSLKAQLADQTAKFSEREGKIATTETAQRAIDAVNKLKASGRWVPAFERMGLPLVFAELAKQTATVEFGEGDGKKTLTPLEVLTQFMDGLPKIVPPGREVAPASAGKSGSVQFTEGKGVKADSNSVALNDLATKLSKEKSISFSEALDLVVAEHPELTLPGGSQAGAV